MSEKQLANNYQGDDPLSRSRVVSDRDRTFLDISGMGDVPEDAQREPLYNTRRDSIKNKFYRNMEQMSS